MNDDFLRKLAQAKGDPEPQPPVARQSTTGIPARTPRRFFPSTTKKEREAQQMQEELGVSSGAQYRAPRFSQAEAQFVEGMAQKTGYPVRRIREKKSQIKHRGRTIGGYYVGNGAFKLSPERSRSIIPHETVHGLHFNIGQDRMHAIADSVEEKYGKTLLNQMNSKYSPIEPKPFPEKNISYGEKYMQRPQEKLAFRLSEPLYNVVTGQSSPQTTQDSLRQGIAQAMMDEASFPNSRTPQDTSSLSFMALRQAIQGQTQQ